MPACAASLGLSNAFAPLSPSAAAEGGGGAAQAAAPRGISWEDWKTEQGKGVPLGRIGKAAEFAALATFLASENAGYITGTAINVDGGRSPVV